MYATTASAQTTVDMMERYGVQAEGEVVGHEYHAQVTGYDRGGYTLAEISKLGGRITRLRILQERGRCDISYVHATLGDGQIVTVSLSAMPSCGLGIRRFEMKKELIEWAKVEGVFAKGLGLLDESNWAVLH